MSIVEGDFLFLSRELINAENEASWRCAASRAYYCAYHACINWHNQLALPGSPGDSKGGVHERLIAQLRNPAPENSAEDKIKSRLASTALAGLRANRTDADYNLEYNFEQSLALNVIARAEALVEKLSLIQTPNLPESPMPAESPKPKPSLRRLK